MSSDNSERISWWEESNRWNPRADGSKDGTITHAMPSARGVPLRIRPVETFPILRHGFWLVGLFFFLPKKKFQPADRLPVTLPFGWLVMDSGCWFA
jgi:hypothetical protein